MHISFKSTHHLKHRQDKPFNITAVKALSVSFLWLQILNLCCVWDLTFMVTTEDGNEDG